MKSIKGHILKYTEENYEMLKQILMSTDWNFSVNSDIDVYSKNVTDHILEFSSECFPNKTVSIQKPDLP